MPAIIVSIRNKYLPISPFVAPSVTRSPDAISESMDMREETQKTTETESDPAPALTLVASEPKLSGSMVSDPNNVSGGSQPAVDSSWISVQD